MSKKNRGAPEAPKAEPLAGAEQAIAGVEAPEEQAKAGVEAPEEQAKAGVEAPEEQAKAGAEPEITSAPVAPPKAPAAPPKVVKPLKGDVTRTVAEGPGGMKIVETVKPGATWKPDTALSSEALKGKTHVVVEGYTSVQMDASFPKINSARIARDLGLDRATCLLLTNKEPQKLEEARKAGLKVVTVANWDRMRQGLDPWAEETSDA